MEPAGPLPGKDKTIVRGPEKLALGDDVLKDAAEAICRAKDLMSGAALHVVVRMDNGSLSLTGPGPKNGPPWEPAGKPSGGYQATRRDSYRDRRSGPDSGGITGDSSTGR